MITEQWFWLANGNLKVYRTFHKSACLFRNINRRPWTNKILVLILWGSLKKIREKSKFLFLHFGRTMSTCSEWVRWGTVRVTSNIREVFVSSSERSENDHFLTGFRLSNFVAVPLKNGSLLPKLCETNTQSHPSLERTEEAITVLWSQKSNSLQTSPSPFLTDGVQ